MAARISADSQHHEQGRTRRDMLAASGGAVALVAVPAVAAEDDAGLARIETLYAEWPSLRREWERLGDLEDEALERWRAAQPPRTPEPEPPAEIAWLWKNANGYVLEAARDLTTPVSIPQHLLDMLDRHGETFSEWLRSRPDFDDPEIDAITEARERIWNETYEVRRALLDTPTRSHRALIIKMIVGFDARDFAQLPKKIEEEGDFGAEFATAILPDLEALAGRAA